MVVACAKFGSLHLRPLETVWLLDPFERLLNFESAWILMLDA